MADLTYNNKNDQKKSIAVFASGVCTTAGHTFADLPAESLVTAVYAVVSKVDPTASSTIDVKIGSTVVANEVPVAALATAQGVSFVPKYFATGGEISFVAGATAPAGTGEIKLVIEFIETEKTTGEYLEA